VRRAAAADWAFYSGAPDGPVDRGDWGMTPQTNDAYNGSLRDIVFPAGILQAPMFDRQCRSGVQLRRDRRRDRTRADARLRRPGAQDRRRRARSATGGPRTDAAKFEARARCSARNTRPMSRLPALHVNGDLTMGENIADLGGLTMALDAYHASLRASRRR
jgi:putative endopeptidase